MKFLWIYLWRYLLIDFTSRDFYKTKIEIIHITQKHTDTVQGLILNVLVQNTNKDLEPTIILNCYGIILQTHSSWAWQIYDEDNLQKYNYKLPG